MGRVAHARRGTGDGRPATPERLRIRVASPAGLPLRAPSAPDIRQHDPPRRGGPGGAVCRACRLRHGQVFRCHLPRSATGTRLGTCSRCGSPRAHRSPLAGTRVSAVGSAAHLRHRCTAHRGGAIQRRLAAEHGRAVVALGAAGRPASLLFRTRFSHCTGEHRRTHGASGAALLSPPCPARRCLGWRLWAPERAHARHRRRLRPADTSHLRGLLRREARVAVGLRLCAPLRRRSGRSNLAMVVPAAGDTRATHCRHLRVAAARAHLHVSAVQLHHTHRPPGAHAMKPLEILTQALELIAALAAAPLFLGWVNQCRAWLQNRRAPSIWLPYRGIRKLFHKDAVIAENASRLFRVAPYIVFGAMVVAAGIIPSMGTRLPFTAAADAIALVGLLATARVFLSLAAIDIGTAFGTLGARREMMVGFLAEPALLMVIFVASIISATTALPAIAENLATQTLGLYPSLAFTAVAFTLILLAENARIPIDNPATHLELTMIHEAMVLEYSARHLALMEWAASLKLFNYACIGFALFLPWGISTGAGGPLSLLASIPLLAVKLTVTGAALAFIETISAKLRVFRAPEFLAIAFMLAVLGVLVHLLLGD